MKISAVVLHGPNSVHHREAELAPEALPDPNQKGHPASGLFSRETWHFGMGAGQVKHAREEEHRDMRLGVWGPK